MVPRGKKKMCFDPHNLKHELCMLVTLVLFMAIIIPSTQLHISVRFLKKKNNQKKQALRS